MSSEVLNAIVRIVEFICSAFIAYYVIKRLLD